MKKKLYFAALLAFAMSSLLTSCGTDWYGPQPPVNFYDSRLTGYWQLVQINGYSVSGYNTNYMYFNGYGNGTYYYYQNNRRYYESLQYWCQENRYSSSAYQVNILYQSSYDASTMDYWFTNGTNALYLRWYDRNGTTTYLYTRYPGAPW